MKRQLTCRSCRSYPWSCHGEYCYGRLCICYGYHPNLLMRCWLAVRSWWK